MYNRYFNKNIILMNKTMKKINNKNHKSIKYGIKDDFNNIERICVKKFSTLTYYSNLVI